MTGSEPWKASGEQAKARAVSDMKAACEARQDAAGAASGGSGAFARAEELAGRAVGCEGMVKEGEGKAARE